MKRIAEQHMLVPILSILYDPIGDHPITIEIDGDYELTGEIAILFSDAGELRKAADLIDLARNALGDVMYVELDEQDRPKNRNDGDIPF